MNHSMVESWTAIISKEIEDVEKTIIDTLHSDNEELDEMCRYVIEAGGKRVRPIICILSHLACGGTNIDRAISVGSAFEIVHTASLVHDDINDNGEVRRGRKTLHITHTLSKAIIAGDFMLVRGYRALGDVGEDVMNIIVKAASMMSESEFMQKDFEHDLLVTEDDYYKIINGKTAMLIYASAMSGAYLATSDAELLEIIGDYSHNVGLAFQVVDDVLDVIGKDVTGKRVGTDLMEGKPTLPIIYAMQDPTYGSEIKALYEKDSISDEDVIKALELIKKTNSIDRCMEKATELVVEAKKSLTNLPDSEYKDALCGLADYIVRRNR